METSIVLESKKLRKKVEKKIFLLSCLFMIINNQLEAFAAPAKQASGGSSSMIIIAGIVIAVVIGAVVFIGLSKKGKTDSKTSEAKKTLTPPTVKAPNIPTPKVHVTSPQQKTNNVTAPVVEKKEVEQKPVVNTQSNTSSQSSNPVAPSFNTPVASPPPKAEKVSSDSSAGVKPLFDSKKLDNDLDNIFADDSHPSEAADKKAPLFNSDQLDNDLDALFIEVNKQPEKPKDEKKGLFDSNKLDSDLDSLFADTPSSSQNNSQNAVAINDDLSSLFSTPSTPKAESHSAPAFDLDSLDFLGGGSSDKKEEKATSSTPAFDLSSLSSESSKNNSSTSNSSFNLDSLDFLGGGSTDKKAEEKQETFTLPSFDLSSITGSGSAQETSKVEPNIPLTEQKIDLSTTTMGINISDYLSSISSEKKVETHEEEKKKQKSEGIISIGKMLVDQNALEEIIKKAEKGGKAGLTTTQVITAVKGRSLDTLLVDINNINGIMGSLIVGKDGLVIANTMPPDIDKDLVGALTSSLFSNLDGQIKKMKKGNLKRLTVETEIGTYVLTEIEMGTLVVFSDEEEKINLAEVFKAISTLTGKK
jgi:predicted regulator of Ras-like GTPase activity (Roadblock/LC7/MglB family)